MSDKYTLVHGFESAKKYKDSPTLTIGDYVFWLAGESSRNPGHIYVKRQGKYVGKISKHGDFSMAFNTHFDSVNDVKKILKDPILAAMNNDKLSGKCSFCNRKLTTIGSQIFGMGPTCLKKWGW